MTTEQYATPLDAENAFYQGLEANNVAGIMDSWSPAEDIICIHPMGPALTGRAAVRESWEMICGNEQRLSCNVVSISYQEQGDIAIHVVREEITMTSDGEDDKYAAMVATNVYRREDGDWHLILHHSSPGAAAEKQSEEVVLH